MARVRYIGPEERVTVPELGGRVVEQDEVVEVPDARFGAYVCQTSNWEGVEEPPDWTPPEPPAEADGESETESVTEQAPETNAPASVAAERPAPARKSSRNTTEGKG